VPDGYYAYDLRHGDSGNPLTIEPHVAVNHAGTVVTSESLTFKDAADPHIKLRGRLNFLGDRLPFEEFEAQREHRQSGAGMTMGGLS
jgi:hypothetical protein